MEHWRDTVPGEPRPDNPADVLAWHMHWLFHRRAVCQCEKPDDDEREAARRALADLTALNAAQ